MSEITINALQELHPLTEDERLDARDAARALVVRAYGSEPTPEQFEHQQMSAYPRWFMGLAITMMTVVFVSAGLVSFFRLFSAGRNHFMESIAVDWQAAIVGFATFILAEFLVMTATVLGSIFVRGRFQKVLTWVAIGAGLLVAFTGNWYITKPHDIWGILETFVPPFAVLATAVIGESMIMDTLRRRAQSKRAFEAAHAEWKTAVAQPEKSDRWRTSYANALREKIKEVNGQGTGQKARREIMQQLDRAAWNALVWREMRADEWFNDEPPQVDIEAVSHPLADGAPTPTMSQPAPMTVSPNGHYETA